MLPPPAGWAPQILDGACFWPLESARLLFRQNVHCTVDADGEHVLGRLKIGIGAVMQHEGPEAAEIGDDGLARFRMDADLARKGQQLQRFLQRDVLRLLSLGDRRALRLLALDGLTQLQIGAEAAGAARDLFARFRVNAEENALCRNGLRTFRPR